jgi:hypothetical protein
LSCNTARISVGGQLADLAVVVRGELEQVAAVGADRLPGATVLNG